MRYRSCALVVSFRLCFDVSSVVFFLNSNSHESCDLYRSCEVSELGIRSDFSGVIFLLSVLASYFSESDFAPSTLTTASRFNSRSLLEVGNHIKQNLKMVTRRMKAAKTAMKARKGKKNCKKGKKKVAHEGQSCQEEGQSCQELQKGQSCQEEGCAR